MTDSIKTEIKSEFLDVKTEDIKIEEEDLQIYKDELSEHISHAKVSFSWKGNKSHYCGSILHICKCKDLSFES